MKLFTKLNMVPLALLCLGIVLPVSDAVAQQKDFVPNAEELAHVFSVATGPAFFLGSITALLAIILGRLNSVFARIKEINDDDDSDNVDWAANNEITVLQKRADTLGTSIYLVLSGGVCTLALLAYMAVGAVFKIEKLYGAGLLFLAATCLVAASMFMFARDVRMDMAQSALPRRRKPTP